MSLIGPWFVATVGVLCVAAFAVTLWCWPRLSRPGPRMLAARAGMLLMVNLLVLTTAAAAVNQSFGFFADWQDLLGAVGAPTVVTVGTPADVATPAHHATGPPTVVPALSGGGNSATVAGTLHAGHLTATFMVVGPRSGVRAAVVVQVPAAYFDPAQAQRRFPVIEAFHGYPGRPQQWVQGMALGGVITAEVAAHRLSEAIIVAPDIQLPAGVDSECVDAGPAGARVETWAAVDVPAWVSTSFRVQPARDGWATIGLSSGGWCAASAALLHPDRFGAAIVLGGYFRPEFSGRAPFPASSAAAQRYDLVALARNAPPPVAVWLETSPADRVSWSTSSAFVAAAHAPLRVQEVTLPNAGHRFGVWQGVLPRALDWLGGNAPGFRPAPTA
jgi:enterochelin esterase-like enzyme